MNEVITDTLEAGEPGGVRTLRVYDKREGDFLIEIPSNSKVTFGYFNPGYSDTNQRGYQNPSTEGRRTALRIYKTEKEQYAVFLGVDGFRDTTIRMTRLKQKVTIETNYEDDGVGGEEFARKAQRALVAAPEDEGVF